MSQIFLKDKQITRSVAMRPMQKPLASKFSVGQPGFSNCLFHCKFVAGMPSIVVVALLEIMMPVVATSNLLSY